MQLTIDRAALACELAILAPAADKKLTVPILSCVHLDARGDRLTLTATDLECGLRAEIPAGVMQEGAICIPAKRLQAFVASLTGDSVAIKTTDNNYASVSAGRARARIAGMDAASFPELPTAPESSVTLDARLLSRTFARVAFAISMEESRFTLNGLLFQTEGSLVRCVATDGHRLAYVEAEGATADAKQSALVPKHCIGHYAKLADSSEGGSRMEYATDDNHLFFAVGHRRLIARKLTGNFPDYSRIMPKHETFVSVDREELKSAIARVAQFADERSHAARFAFSEGAVRVYAQSMECGESEESVPVEGALAMEIGFNAAYVSEGLSAITHPRVAIFLKDDKSAADFRPMVGAGTDQDPYRVATDSHYVIMPMRI